MTLQQQATQVAAANTACRGRKASAEELEKRACSKQAKGKTSPHEAKVIKALRARGLDPIPQKAIGKYNVDLAVGKVVVEIWVGTWHRSKDHTERDAFIEARGYRIIRFEIWRDDPVTEARLDALHEDVIS